MRIVKFICRKFETIIIASVCITSYSFRIRVIVSSIVPKRTDIDIKVIFLYFLCYKWFIYYLDRQWTIQMDDADLNKINNINNNISYLFS